MPQYPHTRNRSGFSSPQFGQIRTSRVYVRAWALRVVNDGLVSEVGEWIAGQAPRSRSQDLAGRERAYVTPRSTHLAS